MLTDWFYLINIISYCCRQLCEMPGNTLKLSGKKSGNFILPNLWEVRHPATLNFILFFYSTMAFTARAI